MTTPCLPHDYPIPELCLLLSRIYPPLSCGRHACHTLVMPMSCPCHAHHTGAHLLSHIHTPIYTYIYTHSYTLLYAHEMHLFLMSRRYFAQTPALYTPYINPRIRPYFKKNMCALASKHFHSVAQRIYSVASAHGKY